MAGITFRAKSNGEDFKGGLVAWAKQMRYATAVALTRTAYIAQGKLYDEFQRSLDRPTRFTMNSLFVKGATVAKPEAEVRTKEGFNSVPAGAYLMPNVEGTSRNQKSSERTVGGYLIPSTAMPLDIHGNVPASVYRQMLSNLRVDDQASSSSTGSKRKRRNTAYFRRDDIIFQRTRTGRKGSIVYGIKPAFIIVDSAPDYRAVIQWAATAERTFDENFGKEFDKAVAQALATAR